MLVSGSVSSLESGDLGLEIVVVHVLIQRSEHLGPHRFVHEETEGVIGTCELLDFGLVEEIGKAPVATSSLCALNS